MKSLRSPRVRRLPLSGVLRAGRPSEIWFKPALSVIAATAPPNLALLALDRLDLAMYAMAGSLCALYAHNRPYAARARALAGVVLGMVGGLAVALVVASLTADAVVLVTVGALLAAVQKVLCDATRIGPPAHVIFTFVTSAALFAPQTLGQVPGHLALAAATGAWAWLVCMAPGLVRPYGPERRATAQALNAAALHVEAVARVAVGAARGGTSQAEGPRTRGAAAAAVHNAWQILRSTGRRTEPRRALAQLLTRAEVALAAPGDTDAGQLRSWARELLSGRPVPNVEGHGEPTELPTTSTALWRTLGPLALRTGLGCALAGYASLALGVGRPYWALVTAASLYQANVTLTWSRGVQRVAGNLVGVLLFAVIVPLAHLHAAALVLCCLALNFGAEALISRNYWLGTICVTPLALLVTEFAHLENPGELITDRLADTVVGALVGLAAAIAVTNRRAGERVEQALTAVERAREHTARTATDTRSAPGALDSARRALAAALVELRVTTEAAAGEWWQRDLPTDRVTHAEAAAHRTLAATVRRHGWDVAEGARA
ncbi:hypothetical protein SGFS_015270 [Streptomyces graminofaciens]|uniref:Integral membrane bound transporter domain-containing protein n=1 Tax=Streptomyces graminofaciens TaxID=68212 RepID=A0ABM7F376_9ACTN|nr:FUSC family protein [Streptomyces graminofaciens]BBC30233.1 hypothetical protein SGFS_015270 [Streptomyces graminofaciens]